MFGGPSAATPAAFPYSGAWSLDAETAAMLYCVVGGVAFLHALPLRGSPAPVHGAASGFLRTRRSPALTVFASPGPIALSLGPLQVRWYGLLLGGAALLGLALAKREALRRGEPLDPFVAACSFTLAGAIAGARLYHVAFNLQYFRQFPWKVFALWEGGAGIFGGILGGVALAAGYTWWHGRSLGRYIDIMAPSLALGQAIGRWGNFFNEEAFGPPTDLPWGLYISPSRRPGGYAAFAYFHPTFLYESLWDLTVFAITFFGLRKRLEPVPGALFLAYLALYAVGRLPIEALRLDSEMLWGFRSAQVVAAACLLVASVGFLWLSRGKRRPPPATA